MPNAEYYQKKYRSENEFWRYVNTLN